MPDFPMRFTLSNGTEVQVSDTFGKIRFLLEHPDGSEHYFILHADDADTLETIEGNNLKAHLAEEKEAVHKFKEIYYQ